MFGFSLAPAIYAALAAAIMIAVYYVTDKVGDYREAQVYERINKAIEGFNQETSAEAKHDAQALAVAEKARAKALESFKVSGGDSAMLTEEEATTLARIK